MSNHVVLCVERPLTSENSESLEKAESPTQGPAGGSSSQTVEPPHSVSTDDLECGVSAEAKPLLQTGECRICQEEDTVDNLESPCACSGSLKFAHRRCVQQWANEKGDITCEICHKSYQPGYTVPPPPPNCDDDAIDISWTRTGSPLDFRDPRILAIAAAERRLLEAEQNDYADDNASGASFFRSVALLLMALFLLGHTLSLREDEDDDASAIFSLFVLRFAALFLPFYVMAWVIRILQQRRQREEAAALAAIETAFMLQAAHNRGLNITIASEPAVTPRQESTS